MEKLLTHKLQTMEVDEEREHDDYKEQKDEDLEQNDKRTSKKEKGIKRKRRSEGKIYVEYSTCTYMYMCSNHVPYKVILYLPRQHLVLTPYICTLPPLRYVSITIDL